MDQANVTNIMNNEYNTGWRGIFREVLDYSRDKLWVTFFLVTISAAVESFGLVLMLPMIEIILLEEPVTSVSQYITNILSNMGAKLWWQRMICLFSVFFAIMLFRAYILQRRAIVIMQLSQGFVDHIRFRLLNDLAYSSWLNIQSLRKAQLLDSLTTNIARISIAIQFSTQLIIAITFAIFFLVTAFIINPAAGALLLLTAIIMILLSAFWLKQSQNLGKRMTLGSQNISQETTRFLDSLKVAKATNAEEMFIKKFEVAINLTRSISVEFSSQQIKIRRGIELLGVFAAFLIVLFGYGTFNLNITEILLIGVILIRMISVLNGGLSGLQNIAFAISAFDAAQNLSRKAKQENVRAFSDREPTTIKSDAVLSISNLRFTFDQNESLNQKYTLVSTDVSFPKTGLVLIEGASGAGKTTFADLLSGLFIPNKGDVSFGDLRLNQHTQYEWQSHVTYIVQDDFIFDGTVRENISWPYNQANDDQIWEALASVNVDKVIRDLPNGLDENLRSSGSRLSGGERQRLGLARGLLRLSRIFIIDEGLSALDAKTTSLVINNLKQLSLERLIILVSHDEKHRDYADAIISIENGNIEFFPKDKI